MCGAHAGCACRFNRDFVGLDMSIDKKETSRRVLFA